MYTLVLHIMNAEPIVGETEELPNPKDLLIKIINPRRMDGKDLHFLAENVNTIYWPVAGINFIEVLTEEIDEEIIGFVRE